MIDLSRVRGVSQIIVIGLVGASGCRAINLIGEVDGGPHGHGPGAIDADVPDSIIIIAEDAGVDPGGPLDSGVGGNPGQIYDAYPGTGGRISTGSGGSVPPPTDASIASDAFGGGCPVSYPAGGFYGENVAYPRTTVLRADVNAQYTFAADVPLGFSLTFTITKLLDRTVAGDAGLGIWEFTDGDYRTTAFDQTNPTQMFMAKLIGRNEMRLLFSGFGQARIDYYECGSATPTRVQFIEWAP